MLVLGRDIFCVLSNCTPFKPCCFFVGSGFQSIATLIKFDSFVILGYLRVCVRGKIKSALQTGPVILSID